MSEVGQLLQIIDEQKDRFKDLNKSNGDVLDYKRECLFARQQILKNNYTLKIAGENTNSLQAAILNVAAIGISLNPANQHAYLVPRDGEICLDISYRGLVKLATDSGAIKWAKAELVYENDEFSWLGPAQQPEHRADPFSDRGELKGGYCIAKLPDGEILTEVMSIDEIHKIRDTSKAYQNNKGPWVDWYHEMAKKTIVKRAYKSWPQTPNRQRLDQAVEVLHQTEGTAYTIDQHGEFMGYVQSDDALGLYAMSRRVPQNVWIALFNSFDKGQKTANKDKVREMEERGRKILSEYAEAVAERVNADDGPGAAENLLELTEEQRELVLAELDEDTEAYAREALQAAETPSVSTLGEPPAIEGSAVTEDDSGPQEDSGGDPYAISEQDMPGGAGVNAHKTQFDPPQGNSGVNLYDAEGTSLGTYQKQGHWLNALLKKVDEADAETVQKLLDNNEGPLSRIRAGGHYAEKINWLDGTVAQLLRANTDNWIKDYDGETDDAILGEIQNDLEQLVKDGDTETIRQRIDRAGKISDPELREHALTELDEALQNAQA